jgi:hypothetical protein
MMIRISKDSLAGGAALGPIVLAMASFQAKQSVATLADLTDNSGGAVADGVVPNVPLATTATIAGGNVSTKAAVETLLGAVRDGLTEIGAKVAAIAAKVPAFTVTNNIGGAAADGTIAAIGNNPAADNVGPRCNKANFNTLVKAYRTCIRELERDVNALATACGLARLTGDAAGDHVTNDHVYALLSTDTGTAAVDSSGGIAAADATAVFTALRDCIAELAAKCNAMTTDTVPAVQIVVSA